MLQVERSMGQIWKCKQIATHLFTSYNPYNSSQYEFYCVLNDKRLCCENKPENSCLSASWKQQFSALPCATAENFAFKSI